MSKQKSIFKGNKVRKKYFFCEFMSVGSISTHTEIVNYPPLKP